MTSIDSLIVSFGDFDLTGHPDGAGDIFLVEDIEGWAGASVDLKTTDRPGDGKRIDKFRYSERELLLRGTAWSSVNADWDVWRVRAKLERIATSAQVMVVHEQTPGVPKQLTVVRNGDIAMDPPKHNVQPYQIPLVAADPRKYSVALHSMSVNGGPEVITNIGTAPCAGTATLQQTTTNPWLEIAPYSYDTPDTINPGSRITIPGTVPAGTIIDFAKKRTWHPSDGYKEMAARPRSWWEVQGTCTLVSNGSWSFTYRDAWW